MKTELIAISQKRKPADLLISGVFENQIPGTLRSLEPDFSFLLKKAKAVKRFEGKFGQAFYAYGHYSEAPEVLVLGAGRLARIEAGFGKSPATNKRLLQNLKSILEREARRGLKAANDIGDEFSINEINEAMNFKLTEPKVSNGGQRRLRFNPQTGRLE